MEILTYINKELCNKNKIKNIIDSSISAPLCYFQVDSLNEIDDSFKVRGAVIYVMTPDNNKVSLYTYDGNNFVLLN